MYSSEFISSAEDDLRPKKKTEFWAAIRGVQKLHDDVVRAHADASFPQRHAIQVSRPLWYLAQEMEALANAGNLSSQEVKQIVKTLRALMTLEDVNFRASEEPLLIIKRTLEGFAYRLNRGMKEDLCHEIASLVSSIDHLMETGKTRRKVAKIIPPKPCPAVDPLDAEAVQILARHIFRGPCQEGAFN